MAVEASVVVMQPMAPMDMVAVPTVNVVSVTAVHVVAVATTVVAREVATVVVLQGVLVVLPVVVRHVATVVLQVVAVATVVQGVRVATVVLVARDVATVVLQVGLVAVVLQVVVLPVPAVVVMDVLVGGLALVVACHPSLVLGRAVHTGRPVQEAVAHGPHGLRALDVDYALGADVAVPDDVDVGHAPIPCSRANWSMNDWAEPRLKRSVTA